MRAMQAEADVGRGRERKKGRTGERDGGWKGCDVGAAECTACVHSVCAQCVRVRRVCVQRVCVQRVCVQRVCTARLCAQRACVCIAQVHSVQRVCSACAARVR
eukprot:2363907-Rhodomonas_salina.1